jgi:hypothetical protein
VTLQTSDHPSAEQVRRAVATTLQRLGAAGCAARLAGEFDDHPELAAMRMTWALATVQELPDSGLRPQSSPMRAGWVGWRVSAAVRRGETVLTGTDVVGTIAGEVTLLTQAGRTTMAR